MRLMMEILSCLYLILLCLNKGKDGVCFSSRTQDYKERHVTERKCSGSCFDFYIYFLLKAFSAADSPFRCFERLR